MKNHNFFYILLVLFSLVGCNEISTKKNSLNNTLKNGQDPILAKDLSKLTAEEVIKTKYKKLQLECIYTIDVSNVKDGGVITETKHGLHNWDIINNTVFNKNLLINEKVLNLTFTFSGNVILSLDSKFSVSLKATDKYEVKTFADDGKLLTNISGDNTASPYILHESQSFNVIEMAEGTSSNSTGNKIKMDCSLISEINSIYK